MILALFLAPMMLTVLSLALLVPVLVARTWAAAEAPMQGDAMPGWALALDAELEAHEWIDAIDILWDDEDELLPPTLPAPRETVPVTLRCPVWGLDAEVLSLASELHNACLDVGRAQLGLLATPAG